MNESRWKVISSEAPAVVLASVVFRSGTQGDSGFVHVETADPQVREFLIYYLEDPLDQHPGYVEGLGRQSGPHSQDMDQFDRAMATLGHFFPSVAAEPDF